VPVASRSSSAATHEWVGLSPPTASARTRVKKSRRPSPAYSRRMRKTGWIAFGLWALPGIFVCLQVSAIGVLFLPAGLLVTILLAKFTRVWPEVLGISEGLAAVCLLIVALNADYWSCPASGEVITRTKDSVTVESCGTLNPWPWLIAGVIFAVVGAIAYRVAKRPPGHGARWRYASRRVGVFLTRNHRRDGYRTDAVLAVATVEKEQRGNARARVLLLARKATAPHRHAERAASRGSSRGRTSARSVRRRPRPESTARRPRAPQLGDQNQTEPAPKRGQPLRSGLKWPLRSGRLHHDDPGSAGAHAPSASA